MFRTSHTLLTLTIALTSIPVFSHAQAANSSGAVFVMTNNANNNQIVAYARNSDGSLAGRHTYNTGGRGSGGVTDPLGSQGSLTLSQDHAYLLAANAGSGDISVFKVTGATLTLLGVTPCGGSEPVAIAQRGNLVYVLNAGAASNVTAFHLTNSGILKQIPNSTAFLSTGNTGAASVAISPNGLALLVTEKLTGNIDAFAINVSGTLGPLVPNSSAGPGLFGVIFAPNGTAITTETGPTGAQNASAVSSYSVSSGGTLTVTSASVPTLANATCWHVVTPDGKLLYTTNPGSGTLSGFWIGSNGSLTPVDGTVLATLPTGSTDLDLAVSDDGKFLYTIDSGTGSISALGVNADGTLNTLAGPGGLAANAGYNGIAAY